MLHLLGDAVADHGVEGPEHLVVADDERDVGAERAEDARHLDGDVAGAHDHRLAGKRLQLEEAVTVDAEVGPGDVVRDGRLAAHRHEHVVRGEDGAANRNLAIAYSQRQNVGNQDKKS